MFRKLVFTTMFASLISINYAYAQSESGKENVLEVYLPYAIAITLQSNPEIKSLSRNIDLAEEDIDLSRSGYRPNVSANGEINHIQSDNDISNKWSSDTTKTVGVALEQPLYRGGQTVAEINQSKTLKDATENRFAGQIQSKVLDIVAVYIETYRANQAIAVNNDNIELLSEQLKATDARFEAGELTKTDVVQAEARLEQANAEKAVSVATYEVALSSFREETGITDEVLLFYPDLDIAKIPLDLSSAISIALQNNPAMIESAALITAQGFNVDAQEGAFYPQVSLNAGAQLQRNPAFGIFREQETANIGVSASLPIYQSGVLRNQLRQSKIRKSQAIDDLEATRLSVTDDVISAWQEHKAIQAQILARQAQIKASELAYEGVSLEEQVGARSVLDVLDANQDVRDAELSLIDAKRDLVNAYYRLLASIGTLDESLWDKY